MSSPVFEEIECKYLDIDPKAIAKKLEVLGANRKFKRLFRRYVFDYPDLRLDEQSAWLRLRDEGDRIALTYKQRQGVAAGKNDAGMTEIEVAVGDFDTTASLLRAVGLVPKFYEENWRTAYDLDGVEVVIDEWPLIPPYVEIEGNSWETVDKAATRLGFDPEEKLICSTMQVYEKYGINESGYSVLTFDQQIKK